MYTIICKHAWNKTFQKPHLASCFSSIVTICLRSRVCRPVRFPAKANAAANRACAGSSCGTRDVLCFTAAIWRATFFLFPLVALQSSGFILKKHSEVGGGGGEGKNIIFFYFSFFFFFFFFFLVFFFFGGGGEMKSENRFLHQI